MTQLAIIGRLNSRHIEIDACTTSPAPGNWSFSDRAAATPRSCSTKLYEDDAAFETHRDGASIARFRKVRARSAFSKSSQSGQS